MRTCLKCGKSGEDLWLNRIGLCEECAISVSKAQAEAEMRAHQQEHQQTQQTPSPPRQANPHLSMLNIWFAFCIICLIIGFVCLLAISFDSGFQYVGGDAYNMQITATVATNWFILALITAVVGSAQYIGECIRHYKKP